MGMAFAMPILPAPLPHPIPASEWRIAVGDRLVIDTAENEGYLVHPNGQYMTFPVVTGKRKFLCYIGRCYNATTPTGTWQVKARDIKGDHITFGPSGRFLRLFRNGEDYTAYGIHEYAYEEKLFAETKRFGSMGCIVVKKTVMDLLDATYAANEGVLNVVTQYGVSEPMATAFAETNTYAQ